MNSIVLSKRMASCQRTVKTLWGNTKLHCCLYTTSLRQLVNPALDSVSVDLVIQYSSELSKSLHKINRVKAGKDVKNAIKLYNLIVF